MRVGVIGVGAMGAPIAASLAAANDVVVFDEDGARRDAAAAAGAVIERSPAAVARASDVVITVLPGAVETESVVGAVLDDLAPGACWLDLGTGDPRATTRLEAALRERDVASVAAPMGGGPSAAESGDLHFTVAGEASAAARVRPLLKLLSAEGGVEHIGEIAAHAQVVKLLSNLLWFGQVVAVTEAMLLGRAAGLYPSDLQRMLAARAGGSVMLERDYAAVLRGDYMPSFGIDRVTEQLAVARALADEHAVPFELSSVVERTHRAALDAFGPVGGELLAARLLEQRAGRPLADG